MGSFQKVLNPSVPSSMSGLTSPDVDPDLYDAPPPVPGAPSTSQDGGTSPGGAPDTTPYDKSISEAESRLNEILGQYPEIDFHSKYQGIAKEIQDRKVSKNPNPLLSFAYALGSPQHAPGNIKDQVLQAHQEQAQKEKDYLSLQEKLIQGDIQQQMAKGQFGLALKQSEKLRAIEQAQKDRERYLDLHGKMTLQQDKYAKMQKLQQSRVQSVMANFHLPEKLRMQAMAAYYKLYQAKQTEKNAFGLPNDSPEEIDNEIMPDFLDQVHKLLPGIVSGNNKKTSPGKGSTIDPKWKAASEAEGVKLQ